MRKNMIKTLVRNDIAYIKSDPMVWMTLCIPILTVIGYHLLTSYLEFLVPYKSPLTYIFINIMPMTTGGVLGLRILEEKDGQLLRYYAVTPLTLTGYFLYRSILSFVISFVGTAFICIGIMGKLPLLLIFYEALIGVLCTFAIGKIAKNKIQGMVLFKPMDSLVILPCIRLLGESQYDGLLRMMPWDLSYQVIVGNEWSYTLFMIYLVMIVIMIGSLIKWMRID